MQRACVWPGITGWLVIVPPWRVRQVVCHKIQLCRWTQTALISKYVKSSVAIGNHQQSLILLTSETAEATTTVRKGVTHILQGSTRQSERTKPSSHPHTTRQHLRPLYAQAQRLSPTGKICVNATIRLSEISASTSAFRKMPPFKRPVDYSPSNNVRPNMICNGHEDITAVPWAHLTVSKV